MAWSLRWKIVAQMTLFGPIGPLPGVGTRNPNQAFQIFLILVVY